ncbi:MAG TPA: preprotein translocase subunit SecG [Thermoanaerobaculia bacterium]
MEFAYIAAIVIYVFVCFFLILVVLLQQGKGADIAGAFGGGGSQTAFGARGATTLLHKLTTGAFIGFIVLALVLTLLEARPRSSVVRTLPQKAATQKAPAPLPRPAGGAVPVPAQPATGAPAAPAPAPANPSGGPAKP